VLDPRPVQFHMALYPCSLDPSILCCHEAVIVAAVGCFCWLSKDSLVREEGEGILLRWQKWGTSLGSQMTLKIDSGFLLPLLLLHRMLSKGELYPSMMWLLVKKS